jgi:micrococcal nuclease
LAALRRTALRLALGIALGAALLLPPGHARPIQAEVVHVSDGDTVWVRAAPGEAARPVRLLGIDAPEICQSHGREARAALQRRLLGQRVRVRARGEDSFGRSLARIEWRGQDQGAWMVAQGHAWAYRSRGRPGPYEAEETLARRERRGLWRDAQPAEPREFRRRHGRCG